MVLGNLIPFKKANRTIQVRPSDELSLTGLQRRMNRLFEDFCSDWGVEPSGGLSLSEQDYVPAVDVAETDKDITVTAELPGMDQKDIEVTLNEDVLTIRGEKKQEKEHKDARCYHRECSYGAFVRSIQLPGQVNQDQVKASFKKGVLKIQMPKLESETSKSKKITIQGD